MDTLINTLTSAYQKIGIMPLTVGWLAWELHTFVGNVADSVTAMVITQQQLAQLMQQLIDLHK